MLLALAQPRFIVTGKQEHPEKSFVGAPAVGELEQRTAFQPAAAAIILTNARLNCSWRAVIGKPPSVMRSLFAVTDRQHTRCPAEEHLGDLINSHSKERRPPVSRG
ncbi:hypothetical protein, partial [Lentzea sp. NPDC060358]|uniref:hypothetical protein n=1 Tax=Lentzea sp. NPDC060358 TaxID=3347103 RepID=UPI0036561E3E